MLRSILLISLLTLASNALAQTGPDVRNICEPILLRASVQSIDKKEDSLLFKRYITTIYQKRTESLENVEKEGFDLSVVIEGVPVSALWSKDSSTKSHAESVYSKYVDNTLLAHDIFSYTEISNNAFALEEYNKCVLQVTSTAAPLICYFSSDRDRYNSTLHIIFKPSFTISDNRIKIAHLTNGFIPLTDAEYYKLSKRQQSAYTTALQQLIAGQRLIAPPIGTSTNLKVPNGRLDTGNYSFTVFRLDSNRKSSIDLLYQNNLGCSPSAEPIAASEITAEIWPQGKDWIAGTDHFEFAQTSGCSKDWSRLNTDFCVSGAGAKITSIDPPHTWSANCDAQFTGAKIKTGSDSCITASGKVGGCGTGPLGDCKGRGWVKTTIIVQKTVPGVTYEPEHFKTNDSSVEGAWTKLFSYAGTLPAGFQPDSWKYAVQVARQLATGTETLVLTEADPQQGDCHSKLLGDTKGARVIVACGIPLTAITSFSTMPAVTPAAALLIK